MHDHEIKITSFDPLTLVFPTGVKEYTGKIKISLPPVHVQILDLSLGGMLPDAHVGADMEGYGVIVTLVDGAVMTSAEMFGFIEETLPRLAKIHRLFQKGYDEHGALL